MLDIFEKKKGAQDLGNHKIDNIYNYFLIDKKKEIEEEKENEVKKIIELEKKWGYIYM